MDQYISAEEVDVMTFCLRYPQKFFRFLREVKSSSKESTRVIKFKFEPSTKYPPNRIVTSKYTLWNFLPKNLFEQFRRIGNFYFLCIAIIALIIESPVSPVTSIAPLVFVITVTAIKQGYEDFLRHKADKEVNNYPVTVIRRGVQQIIPSKCIRVGDVVKIHRDQDIPCDLVFLMSSNAESKCFVTTANLDGETDLKTLHCPKSLKKNCKTEAELTALEATIRCENPTPYLYKFHGRLEFGRRTSALLRQSAQLREQSLYAETVLDNHVGNKSVDKCRLNNNKLYHNTIDDDYGRGEEEDEEDEYKESNKDDEEKKREQNKSEIMKSPLYARKKYFTKRTESFPKSAIKTHKKTLSNVERMSFNLERNDGTTSRFKDLPSGRKASFLSKRIPSFLRVHRPLLTTVDGNVADSLSSENLILRGSKLKNTEFVYGCAVYTGSDTKLALNSKLTSNKFSSVEKSINKYLLFYLGLLIFQVVVSTTFKVINESQNGYEIKLPYIENDDEGDVGQFSFASVLKDFFCFVALYNYVIPISLYVTLELQKFLGTLFFEWDIRLYDEDVNETAVCNTSDLNEDLGQIEYLFTDKTGTLTKNEMQFERCSVNGITYEEKNGHLYPILEGSGQPNWEAPVDLKNCSREMELFLCALTLCHTVQTTNGGKNYNATSPDEKALVEAMKKLDIVFEDEDDDMMAVKILGQSKVFKKLDVLEFSSDRKRMSVIIEDDEENIILYCKGAETSVIPQVKKGPKDITLKHVADFATQRLRTLVVGYKFISRENYERMADKLKNARQTLSNERESIVAETYRKIESNLTVLGATGIKDDIQEEVRETLKSLKEAGIKIWMLTGDKLETAENVSLDCGHFEESFIRLVLQQQKNPDSCRDILARYLLKIEEEKFRNFGLIVDGESLTMALAYHRDLFRNVCVKCSAVICSRMSPLQKKEVVRLIKDQKPSPITAAIGDGANDVSMIQEAHVGIGIMGKEGRQAVRCSDFAFSKFKCLKRTFLVHGHWYYLRVANLVQYFFYKNIAFVLPQFFFLFFSGYSVQSLYDGAYLTGYNTIFTSFPVLIFGLFEQNYRDTELEKSPDLYLIHKRNALMSWKNFISWFLLGLWHSIVVFFFPTFYYLHNPSVMIGGRDVFLESYGTLIFHCSVTVVNLKLLLHSRYWSLVFVSSLALSIVALALFSVIYSIVYVENFTSNNFWVYINLLGSPSTWLMVVLVCAASLTPDFTLNVIKNVKDLKKH